jgi:hypothetical protein
MKLQEDSAHRSYFVWIGVVDAVRDTEAVARPCALHRQMQFDDAKIAVDSVSDRLDQAEETQLRWTEAAFGMTAESSNHDLIAGHDLEVMWLVVWGLAG